MSIHFVPDYTIGLLGAAIGVLGGPVLISVLDRESRLLRWDARVTLPLVLGAAAAHASLLGAVELQRQVLFGLYALALLGVALFALQGIGLWRLGAIVLPLGSIGAYIYFGLLVHQVDYTGLFVKLIELAAIAAAVVSIVRMRRSSRAVATST